MLGGSDSTMQQPLMHRSPRGNLEAFLAVLLAVWLLAENHALRVPETRSSSQRLSFNWKDYTVSLVCSSRASIADHHRARKPDRHEKQPARDVLTLAPRLILGSDYCLQLATLYDFPSTITGSRVNVGLGKFLGYSTICIGDASCPLSGIGVWCSFSLAVWRSDHKLMLNP